MTANTAQRVDVERLRELLAKATNLPWQVDGAVCGKHDTTTRAIYHRDESRGYAHVHEVIETGCKCGDEAIGEADAELIVAAVNALPALLLQVAEGGMRVNGLRAELEHERRKVADLSVTWTDEGGTTWRPPTAWAYAQSCRVREEQRTRAEAAERAREEACGLLRDVAACNRGDQYVAFVDEVQKRVAAFLAANGGL